MIEDLLSLYKNLTFWVFRSDGFQEDLSSKKKSLICFGRNVMELKDFVACLSFVEVGDFTKFHILLLFCPCVMLV